MSYLDPVSGFEPHFRKSKVTEPWEPVYSRRVGSIIQIGLWLSDNHCNSRKFAHGGVIASLADNAIGLSCIFAYQDKYEETEQTQAVTLNLSINYVSSAKAGQWLQVEPHVIKVGRSIGFADALVTADAVAIAKASAVFMMV